MRQGNRSHKSRAMLTEDAALPELEECNSLTLRRGDVLITAGGFEDRASAASESVVASEGGKAIVLRYRPVDPKNRDAALVEYLESKRVSVLRDRTLLYDRFDPHAFPDALAGALDELGATRVTIDISAMSKLAILLTLDVCRQRSLEVTVFYAEAKEYGPTETEYESARRERNVHRPTIQVYTGVHGVVGCTRLSSVAMQGQPLAAIAFMSLNECLTQALVNSVYPSRLFLINGRPPKLLWREEATAWIHEQLRREWPASDNPMVSVGGRELPERATSTLDYTESVRKLNELYWRLCVDHRVLLAPTGSKMQTLACYVAKAMHPDIHVEYPTPEGFLTQYSTGVGDKWVVHFGQLNGFIERLRCAEKSRMLGFLEVEALRTGAKGEGGRVG